MVLLLLKTTHFNTECLSFIVSSEEDGRVSVHVLTVPFAHQTSTMNNSAPTRKLWIGSATALSVSHLYVLLL